MHFRCFPKEKKPQRLLYGGKGFYAYLGHEPRLLKRNVYPVIAIEFQCIPDTRVKLKRFGVELRLIDGDGGDGLSPGICGDPRCEGHGSMTAAIVIGTIAIVSRDIAGGATSRKIHAGSEREAIGNRPIVGDAANPAVRLIDIVAKAARDG